MNDAAIRRRFREVCERYRQVVGKQPPALPRNEAELASVANRMLEEISGARHPEAGLATQVVAIDVTLNASGGLALVTLADAEGRLAETQRIALDKGVAEVKALLALVESLVVRKDAE